MAIEKRALEKAQGTRGKPVIVEPGIDIEEFISLCSPGGFARKSFNIDPGNGFGHLKSGGKNKIESE